MFGDLDHHKYRAINEYQHRNQNGTVRSHFIFKSPQQDSTSDKRWTSKSLNLGPFPTGVWLHFLCLSRSYLYLTNTSLRSQIKYDLSYCLTITRCHCPSRESHSTHLLTIRITTRRSYSIDRVALTPTLKVPT